MSESGVCCEQMLIRRYQERLVALFWISKWLYDGIATDQGVVINTKAKYRSSKSSGRFRRIIGSVHGIEPIRLLNHAF